MKLNVRYLMFRIWYWYISKVDADAEITFMNYGYDDDVQKIELDPEDEPNRYSIQLYHRLASVVEIKDKSIVEIGCGRGGGLAYITKTFTPAEALGIDLEPRAIDFASRFHPLKGLSFKQGDALNIPLNDNSCDVLLNVESSHRYLNMGQFLAEVSRVLKDDGYFLFTDFRYPHEIPVLKNELIATDMELVDEQQINRNVIAALVQDTPRRKDLVEKLLPRIFHKTGFNFAGVIDSPTYKQILSEDLIYFIYIFKKSGSKSSIE